MKKYFQTLGQAEEASIEYGLHLDRFINLNVGKFRCGIVYYDDEQTDHAFFIDIEDPNNKADSEYLKEFIYIAEQFKTFCRDYLVTKNGTKYVLTFRPLSFIEYEVNTLENYLRDKHGRLHWEKSQ